MKTICRAKIAKNGEETKKHQKQEEKFLKMKKIKNEKNMYFCILSHGQVHLFETFCVILVKTK